MKSIALFFMGLPTGLLYTTQTLAHNPLEFSLETAYNTGKVGGYAQTPKGGNVGTTSFKRPTFDELGIHHDDFYDVLLRAKHDTWGMFGQFRHLSPSKNGTTDSFLITHNQSIPDNSPINGNISYRWYQVGLTKTFGLGNWHVTPELTGNYMHYRYQFTAPLKGSIREFGLSNVALGLTAEYAFTQKLSAHLIAKGSIPLFNLTHYEGAIRLSYAILEKDSFSLRPFIGIGALYIDEEDSQTIPNHNRYENIPYGAFGVNFVF